MNFEELFTFDVVRSHLSWPWLSFSANGAHVAYASSTQKIATRSIATTGKKIGNEFTLPSDFKVGSFSINSDASLLAVSDGSIIATIDASGERARVPVSGVQAIAFDRSGTRLWVSAESESETLLYLIAISADSSARSSSLNILETLHSPAFPRPAVHELHLHPQDDAVLLLAACGDDGTFARVAGFAGDDVVSAIPTALDAGGIAAGFVGFSSDGGARVHLVEADELRTHAWPTLDELSSVELADDFISSFSGAVVGHHLLIDGEEADTQEDAVMLFDQAAIRGTILNEGSGAASGVPLGMWAGQLTGVANGHAALVTVESKGDPARAHVWKVTPSKTALSS